MARQAKQRSNLSSGHAGDAHFAHASVWPGTRASHRQAHSAHLQRIPADAAWSLYPALHRLEQKGWVTSKWETAPDRNQEFKYYRLTDNGKKQLLAEESQWKQMAEAVARVMWPIAEEG